MMASLPEARVTPSPPFTHTDWVGLDFGSPIALKASSLRNAKILKGYFCVFNCFSTKAVHVELISELSSDSFLAGLDNFIARRGLLSCMYSDQGRNFVGANRQIKEVHDFLDSYANNLFFSLQSRYLEWKFIPPYSPNFGGLWERAIKSIKALLYKATLNRS